MGTRKMGKNQKGLKKVPSNDRSDDFYTYEYITEVKRWFVKGWRENKNGAKIKANRQRPQPQAQQSTAARQVQGELSQRQRTRGEMLPAQQTQEETSLGQQTPGEMSTGEMSRDRRRKIVKVWSMKHCVAPILIALLLVGVAAAGFFYI